MSNAHVRRMQDAEALVEQPDNQIIAFSPIEKWFVVRVTNLEDLSAKSRGSLAKPPRLEFRFAEVSPVAWMAPFAQSKFSGVRVAYLKSEYLHFRMIAPCGHHLRKFKRGGEADIVLQKNKKFSNGGAQANVASCTRADILGQFDVMAPGIFRVDKVRESILRVIIDDNDFERCKVLPQNGIQGFADGFRPLVIKDNHADDGNAGVAVR